MSETQKINNDKKNLSACYIYIHLKSGSIIKTADYRNDKLILMSQFEKYCNEGSQTQYSFNFLEHPSSAYPDNSAKLCIDFKNVEAIFISEINQSQKNTI